MPTPILDQLGRELLRLLARLLTPYLPPRRPLPVGVAPFRQERSVLYYKPILPAPGAPDVVRRELTQVVNGTALDPIAADDSTELGYADGDAVTLTLVDIDDAGNRSEPSEPFAFTATDTIAPPAPGQVGVTLVREA